MGIKFPQSVNKWLRENGFLPEPGEKHDRSIESDRHENSEIHVGCVDLDTKIKQLLARFTPGEPVPLARLTGFFQKLLGPVLSCQIVVATFDPRVKGATIVPRQEVAIARQKEQDKLVSRAPIDFDTIVAIDPHQADAADKIGFRTFLATSLAERSQSLDIAVFAPDNTIHGSEWLCRLLEDVTEFTEGDTRIPAALCALRRAGRLDDRSRVAVWTNDTDSLWMMGSVGPLAAFHLHRPPPQDGSGKPDIVLDLVKLKNSVEARFKCNYISWLFWICLFRGTDYTSTPPGFCSLGNQLDPPEDLLRLDLTKRRLAINRRQLRGLLFRAANRDIPPADVARHFNRLVWSTALYLLLKPDPRDFGWTDTPMEYVHTDILRLNEELPPDNDGWIYLVF